MARLIDEFVLAWSALSGDATGEGWRSIAVNPAGPCTIMAGRRFPSNEEALIAGFLHASIPPAETLPEGYGFDVSRADPHGDGKTWIALTRKESGSIELFAEMVGDVAGAMDAAVIGGEEIILRTFLTRVRAWQEFMRRGVQALSPEAELGLVGELVVIEDLLGAGLSPFAVVEGWIGPIGGIQDFNLGYGAIEVKATLSEKSFSAKIGSLEQLDDAILKPLFLAGLRFSQRESGRNLPDIAAQLSDFFSQFSGAGQRFSDRLLSAGYHVSHAANYRRRFSLEMIKVLEVGDGFPRIVRGDVPGAVICVKYEIDIDRIPGSVLGLGGALAKLGVV